MHPQSQGDLTADSITQDNRTSTGDCRASAWHEGRKGWKDKSETGGVPMLYEWRTYEAMPGKFLALQKHLEIAAGLFQKHGLGVLGFWTEEIGTGFQVTYMWKYADVEER